MQQQAVTGAAPDSLDAALADDYFGTVVTWMYEGCPHYSPRQQLQGVVLDVQTSSRGVRYLLVKAEGLNLPRRVRLEDVQFLADKQKATAAA